jgi:hypothetical protein
MPTRPIGDLERRVIQLETSPHLACPAPVLVARLDHLEDWEVRQNGDLRELRVEVKANHEESQTALADSRKERFEQIEKLRIDQNARIDKLIATLISVCKWLIGTMIAIGGLALAIVKLMLGG